MSLKVPWKRLRRRPVVLDGLFFTLFGLILTHFCLFLLALQELSGLEVKLRVHHEDEWLLREKLGGLSKEEVTIEEADDDDLPLDEQLKVGLKEALLSA